MISVVSNRIIHGFKSCFKITWFLMLWSCLSPIDFETDDVGGKLVVGGQISTVPEQNFVQLGSYCRFGTSSFSDFRSACEPCG